LKGACFWHTKYQALAFFSPKRARDVLRGKPPYSLDKAALMANVSKNLGTLPMRNRSRRRTNIGTIRGPREEDLQLDAAYGEGQGLFSARGTFRISDERDESRQPAYNLAQVRCERKAADYDTQAEIECTVTEASVGASSGAPSPNAPNCILDVDVSVFIMKEIGKGVLAGMADNGGSTSCYNATLTINRNTKRVLRSFERTQYADNYDRSRAGTCGPQRTQALMNCTAWVGIAANNIPTQGERLCDFEEH
jgi:hypothetical protein